jgi:hypothetical protein
MADAESQPDGTDRVTVAEIDELLGRYSGSL